MALRNIVEYGDPCLEQRCRPVTEFDGRLHQLLDDLRDTLAAVDGAGLAAPQVGVLRRVCVVNLMDEGVYVDLVNPEIVAQSGEQTGLEGCLSVPGRWGLVTRPSYVQVRFQDRDGNWQIMEGTGMAARAFCHEIEHLDGHLYTEYIDRFLTPEEVDYYSNEEQEGREIPKPVPQNPVSQNPDEGSRESAQEKDRETAHESGQKHRQKDKKKKKKRK